jgi:hypothetical protein
LAPWSLKEAGDIHEIQISKSTLLRESKHDAFNMIGVGYETSRPAIEVEGIECREKESQHHFKSRNRRMQLGHDIHKTLRGGLILLVYRDPAF